MQTAAVKKSINNIEAVDWPLLIFITGVTNVKLYVKVAALLFYVLYFLYKRYSLRRPLNGITAFYLLMPVGGIIGALIHGSFNDANYKFAFLFGTAIWLVGGAASWLIYLSARRIKYVRLTATLKLFFALNFIVSIGQLIFIMLASKNAMPYWYRDVAGLYGVSTGDHITGITGNSSTLNGVITTLGVLFFYFRKEWRWLIVCLLSMVLCTTNLTLLCFLGILIIICIFVKGAAMKLKATILFFSTIGIYWFVSPMNMVYMKNVFTEFFTTPPYSPPSAMALYYSQHMDAFYHPLVKDSVYSNYGNELAWLKEQSQADTVKRHSVLSNRAISVAIQKWYGLPVDATPLNFIGGPGKKYAFEQTIIFARSSSKNWPGGAGMGNFSSRLALRTTALDIDGKYPGKYAYISRDFFSYHFYDILYYYSLAESEHSVINMPNNVYVQLLGEYGVAGLLLFLVFYLGYFWKNRKQLSYGWYISGTVLLFFCYEYWFEMISLTVFFELLMFMDIFAREKPDGTTAADNSTNARI